MLLAHLSRRLIGELIVHRSSRRPSVRASVRPFTHSNMNISATSRPIGMKLYLKHHWGGGKASVGFDPDRIRTLVSIATVSRMPLKRFCLYLQVTMTCIRPSMSSKFGRIGQQTTELAAFKCMKTIP